MTRWLPIAELRDLAACARQADAAEPAKYELPKDHDECLACQ